MAGKTIRYLGDGTEFLFGIPAKDLTGADWDALTDAQQATVKASPLYDTAPAPVKSDPAPVVTAPDAATA